MTVLSAANLKKSFGVEDVFSDVSFSVNKGDRIGLVGPNGAGKSTLLKILAGETGCEEGSVYAAADTVIGFFHQNDLFSSEKTIYEEMLAVFSDVRAMEKRIGELGEEIAAFSSGPEHDEAALEKMLGEYDRLQQEFLRRDGFSYQSEIQGVLRSMHFPDEVFGKNTSSLSGGERTRLALAVQLLRKPDVLFLDEPTNHLDIDTLRWLEQYLRGYPGTVIVISHDRYFLDHTVNRIFELNNGRLRIYEGNYTFYAAERKARLASEMKAFEKQQTEIRRQEDMIRRFKQRGTEKLAKRARSREKMLERTERLDRPAGPADRMKIQFRQESVSGNDTLHAEGVAKTLGREETARQVMTDVNFDIKRGERICVIGPNGAGKSTLLKMILSEIRPDAGFIKVGHNIVFGYYDQEQSMLDESGTVIEEMRDAYEQYDDRELRGLLGKFLFRGDDVFKPVSVLSGGERARLSLLKLMLSGANMLILDEPTNHLDIESKEVFEDALIDFPGTSVTVSHDRYLLNRVPTSIYELDHGTITEYKGNYDYYLEKKASMAEEAAVQAAAAAGNGPGEAGSAAAGDAAAEKQKRMDARRNAKELQAKQRRRERRIEALEEQIAALEEDIAGMEEQLGQESLMSDHVKLAAISEQLSGKKEEMDTLFQEWEALSEETEIL